MYLVSCQSSTAGYYWQQLDYIEGQTYKTQLEVISPSLHPRLQSIQVYKLAISYSRALYRLSYWCLALNPTQFFPATPAHLNCV